MPLFWRRKISTTQMKAREQRNMLIEILVTALELNCFLCVRECVQMAPKADTVTNNEDSTGKH